MENDNKQISLTTLGDGAAVEMFDDQLAKVVADICDVNTKTKAPRKITFTATVTPDEERERLTIDLTCTSSMAPPKSFPTTGYIARDKGKLVAIEQGRPKQVSMFDKATADNVRPIGERG